MRTWLLILVLAVGTVLMKTIGPVLAGGRQPPAPLTRVIALTAPGVDQRPHRGRHLHARPATGHRCPRSRARSRRRRTVVRAPTAVALLLAAIVCAVLRLRSPDGQGRAITAA